MIVTITLNPALDKTVKVNELTPGEMYRSEDVFIDVGGKGINVSKTLKKYGVESTCIACLAGQTGQKIKQELLKQDIQIYDIEISGETRTNLKIVDKDGRLTEFNELGPKFEQKDIDNLEKLLKVYIRENDIVVLSGSLPVGIATNYYATIIQLLNEKKARVIVDADGESFRSSVEMIPYAIKPNERELYEYFKIKETLSIDEVKQYAQRLIDKGIQLVVVSLGERGSIYINKNEALLIHGLEEEIVSTVGAGDSMVAAIAYATEKGLTLDELARLATASASAVVASPYTCIKEMHDVEIRKDKLICQKI